MNNCCTSRWVAWAGLSALALAGAGCMGTPPRLVVVEPTYVLEHVADADVRTLASWPVIAPEAALVAVTPAQRGTVAELAYLEQ